MSFEASSCKNPLAVGSRDMLSLFLACSRRNSHFPFLSLPILQAWSYFSISYSASVKGTVVNSMDNICEVVFTGVEKLQMFQNKHCHAQPMF